MIKPDDIPQDVWDRADDLAFYDPATEGWDGRLNRHKLREVVARAVMAAKAEEREACANIAGQHVGGRIASAIRKRGEAD